jgi:hypothetical protein
MRLFRRIKKMVNENQNKKLSQWKAKLEEAKGKYSEERKHMITYRNYYKGGRDIQPNVNKPVDNVKKASNVRNIVYELVESQVDSSIPMPKVRAIHSEDDELAVRIEKLLESMVQRLQPTSMGICLMRRTFSLRAGVNGSIQIFPS